MARGQHGSTSKETVSEDWVSMGVPSNAVQSPASRQASDLLLPRDQRGAMPLTKNKYAIRENQDLIEWERVTRQFLRKLQLAHEHRVTAVMVFEWATGKSVKAIYDEGGNANAALRYINTILRHYYGEPFQTWILSKKVKQAYRVPIGYQIKQRRPLTMELYVEYLNKTLADD